MVSGYCPECEERITLNPHARLGQKLTCPECEADLEVICVKPLEFDWAYDWSDEDGDCDSDDDEDW